MADDDQYALCWNNFNKNLTAGFHSLYSRGHFTDVTLSAGGQLLKAHRMVLSVCSPYFQAMFESTPVTQHPIIFLKDITFKNLTDLVQFMYCGEVHVKQDELSGFIAIAESLQIKGLTESGESSSSPDNSKHDTSASSRPLRAAKRTRKRELEDIISTPLKVGKRTSTTALRQGKKLSTHSQDPLQQDTPIPSTSTAEFIEMDALQTKTEPASFDDQDMDSSYMQADDTFNASELVEKDDNYEHSYSEADDAHEEKESRDEINNTDTAFGSLEDAASTSTGAIPKTSTRRMNITGSSGRTLNDPAWRRALRIMADERTFKRNERHTPSGGGNTGNISQYQRRNERRQIAWNFDGMANYRHNHHVRSMMPGKIIVGLNFLSLQAIAAKEPHEIVMELTNKKQEFLNFVKDTIKMDENCIVVAVKILAKLCETAFNSNKLEILTSVCKNKFIDILKHYVIKLSLDSVISSLRNSAYLSDPEAFWNSLLMFYKTIIDLLPNTAYDTLRDIMFVTKIGIPMMMSKHKFNFSQAFLKEFEDIKNQFKFLIEQREKNESRLFQTTSNVCEKTQPHTCERAGISGE